MNEFSGRSSKSTKFALFIVILSVVLLLSTVSLFCLFVMVTRNHQSNEDWKTTKKPYMVLKFDPSSNKFSSSTQLLPIELEDDDFFSFEDEVGNNILVAEINSLKFKASGHCYCDEERRSIAASTSSSRVVYYLLSASSAVIALNEARNYFRERCVEMMKDECETVSIRSDLSDFTEYEAEDVEQQPEKDDEDSDEEETDWAQVKADWEEWYEKEYGDEEDTRTESEIKDNIIEEEEIDWDEIAEYEKEVRTYLCSGGCLPEDPDNMPEEEKAVCQNMEHQKLYWFRESVIEEGETHVGYATSLFIDDIDGGLDLWCRKMSNSRGLRCVGRDGEKALAFCVRTSSPSGLVKPDEDYVNEFPDERVASYKWELER